MTGKSGLEKKLKKIKDTHMADKDFAAAIDELLVLRKSDKKHIKLNQQLALCCYKDVETAPTKRYAEALKILESIGLGKDDCDPETLRLGGAIYKRKWQFDGRLENLHHAYSLYREAADTDPNDQGYGT